MTRVTSHPSPASRARANKPHGFTLIELLVVISIIALLIAFLLPALSSARDAARTTLCSSTIRSNAVAINLYVNDYDGRLMPARQADPSGGGTFWFLREWFRPYLDYPSSVGAETIVKGHFVCPEWNGTEFNDGWHLAYTLNYTGQVSTTPQKQHTITFADAETTPFFLPLEQWKSPSEDLLLFDGREFQFDSRQVQASTFFPTEGGNANNVVNDFLNNHYFPPVSGLPYDPGNTGFRHAGEVSVGLFGDGHTAVVTRESVDRAMLDHEF